VITNAELQLVMFIGLVIGLAGAVWSLAAARDAYESIGRGFLDVTDSMPAEPELPPGAEELEEARQLLEARSASLVRRGEEPLELEEELAEVARRYLDGPAGGAESEPPAP
jgi:hypothetical protein